MGDAERLRRAVDGPARESNEEVRLRDEGPRLDSRPRDKLRGNKRPSNPDIMAAMAFRPWVFFFTTVWSDDRVDTSDFASSSMAASRAVGARRSPWEDPSLTSRCACVSSPRASCLSGEADLDMTVDTPRNGDDANGSTRP